MTKRSAISLPIDRHIPTIVESVREKGALVLRAEPGAGKTTRVPPALLELAGGGEVWVLEPRRIAARLAAGWVAKEMGETVGGVVGYQVRHENVGGPRTRLRFLTEGVFTRRIVEDPGLKRLSVLVLDEFHERHLHGDLALAFSLALRARSRPDLKVVVMSATIESDRLAEHLGGAPLLAVEGRAHPVTVEHLESPDGRPLPERAAAAVRRHLREASPDDSAHGDVLVFLPGAAEIRRTREQLEPFARERDVEIVPLHGALPAAEQDKAVSPGPRRKVILATNVAETSITLPSVTCVVDSGLARLAVHSPWSGLPALDVRPIAGSSAEQRAGRAGRVAPGRCVRLYSRHDLMGRPEHTSPEIARSDLSELCLTLSAAGFEAPEALPWLDAPPATALAAARELLERLGAVDGTGAITELGERMARLPVHPRQARMLLEADREGVFEEACILAAMVGARDVLERGRDLHSREATIAGDCDLLERYDRIRKAGVMSRGGAAAGGPRRFGLDPGAVGAVARAARQLRGLGPRSRRASESAPALSEEQERSLRQAVLAAWPDRVARRRRRGESVCLMADGGEVRLAPSSVVRESDWLVAVDATSQGKAVVCQLATAIEPDWLVDLFPERVTERVDVIWNAKARRVEAMSRMLFGEAVLMEARERAHDRPEAWALLADQARRAGIESFADPEAVEALAGRLRVAADVAPEAGYTILDRPALDDAVGRLCKGRSRLEELSTAGLIEAILAPLSWEARARLDELAPTHVRLPGRKRAPVRYPAGAPPFVASRLQDFFGLQETPRIAKGRLPLVVHLLAPNNRPVQVTGDLKGFWERHYPEIRRQLSRRYPRHAWPEDPR